MFASPKINSRLSLSSHCAFYCLSFSFQSSFLFLLLLLIFLCLLHFYTMHSLYGNVHANDNTTSTDSCWGCYMTVIWGKRCLPPCLPSCPQLVASPTKPQFPPVSPIAKLQEQPLPQPDPDWGNGQIISKFFSSSPAFLIKLPGYMDFVAANRYYSQPIVHD